VPVAGVGVLGGGRVVAVERAADVVHDRVQIVHCPASTA